ncbi:MAG: DUF2723 domain-containing protein, partial [Candidatus Kapabacteria bacterium]|nr:DUF2723 domain-containing protein [Candidatus Kapabacteria bacterium]MDW7997671.1 DUF2723 domain-containing protein [Bacteroidota bacterium]
PLQNGGPVGLTGRAIGPTFIGISCATIAAIVYIATLAPDVTYTDAGELAACCVTWGVAHPTGYPLFTLLGHLWTALIPFVPPIVALNALAALWTALSTLAFFGLCWETLRYHDPPLQPRQRSIICALAALTYALARTVWEQATVIEVYSLHLLLLWLTAWAAFRARRTSSLRWLLLASYLFGLGLTNHATMTLLAPALLWFFIPLFRQRQGASPWLCLAAAILPLTLYLTLVLRSAAAPPLDWGGVARGWTQLLYHVTGKQYQVWMFTNPSLWEQNAGLFFQLVPWQLGVVGIPVVLVGMWQTWRHLRPLWGWIMLVIVVCLVYALNYDIHDIAPYFLQAYGGMLLAAAAGAAWLWTRLPRLRWFLLLMPATNLIANWNSNDRSHDRSAAAYVQLIADIAAPNAIIISAQWDFWCSAFWYKQRVEGLRPDIALVEQELVRRTWYLQQLHRWYPGLMECCIDAIQFYNRLLEPFEAGRAYDAARLQRAYENVFNTLIAAHLEDRPVYVTPDVLLREPAIGAAYQKIPEGPLIRLSQSADTLSERLGRLELSALVQSLRQYRSKLDHALWNTLVRGFTASALFARQQGQSAIARRLEEYLKQLGAPSPTSP